MSEGPVLSPAPFTQGLTLATASVHAVSPVIEHSPWTVKPWGGEGLHIAAVVISTLYLSTMFLLSVVGNSLVLYVLMRHLRWTSYTNSFIASLALSDLLASILCLPPTLVSVFYGGCILVGVPCVISGVIQTALAIVSTLMVTCVAVERYKILGSVPRAAGTSRKMALLLIGCSWGVGFLLAVPFQSLLDGQWEFNQNTNTGAFFHCTLLFHTVMGRGIAVGTLKLNAYRVVIIVVCFVFPVGLMSFCCVRLVRILRRNGTNVRPASSSATQLWFSGEMRTAKSAMIMVCLHVITRGPYILMGLYSVIMGIPLALITDTVCMWLFWASCIVNPIIYAQRSPNFLEMPSFVRRHSVYQVETPNVRSSCTTPVESSTGNIHFERSDCALSVTAIPAWNVASTVSAPACMTVAELTNNNMHFDAFTAFNYSNQHKGVFLPSTINRTYTTNI